MKTLDEIAQNCGDIIKLLMQAYQKNTPEARNNLILQTELVIATYLESMALVGMCGEPSVGLMALCDDNNNPPSVAAVDMILELILQFDTEHRRIVVHRK